jgi:hypothetical protein
LSTKDRCNKKEANKRRKAKEEDRNNDGEILGNEG